MTNVSPILRNTVIKRALRLCNVVAEGEDPTGSQQVEAVGILESFLKAFNAEMDFAVNLTQISFPAVIGQSVYPISTPTGILDILTAFSRNAANEDRWIPLVDTDWFDRAITNKTKTGAVPECGFVEMLNPPRLTIFPTPSQADTIYVRVLLHNVNTLGAASPMPVPDHVEDALTFGLAHRLAFYYHIPNQEKTDLKNAFEDMKAQASRHTRNMVQETFFYRI